MTPRKQCTKCKQPKHLDLFHNYAASPDGKKPWCKECSCGASRDYQATVDPVTRKVRRKTYYDTHKDAEIANTLAKRDPIAYKKYMAEYHAKNKESAAADYAANPLKYKERNLRSKFGMTLDDYDQILSSQGDACAICGH